VGVGVGVGAEKFVSSQLATNPSQLATNPSRSSLSQPRPIQLWTDFGLRDGGRTGGGALTPGRPALWVRNGLSGAPDP